MSQPTVLITGVSSGLGAALAQRYLAQGVRLVAVGRTPSQLPGIFECRADPADPSAALQVARFLRTHAIERIDRLMLNAGVGHYGSPEDADPAAIRTILAVNLRSPIALTHALLPWIEPVNGKITLISSVVADLPAPNYALYAASKAALGGFARSLRAELHPKVGVQVIYPGAMRTAMHERSGIPLSTLRWDRFPPVEQAAQAIVEAIKSGAPEVTIGPLNNVVRWAGRYLPWLVDRSVR